MIVDDHAAFREMLRTFLRTTEATFLECEDGRDAVAEYPGFQPDVVLTHQYDFGTTSETLVKFVAVRSGKSCISRIFSYSLSNSALW